MTREKRVALILFCKWASKHIQIIRMNKLPRGVTLT